VRLSLVLLVGALAVAGAGCGASGTGRALTHSSSSQTRSLASSASGGPAAVVRAYWHDIATGHYRAAFRRFDRAEQKRSHGQHWFVADKVRDAPIRVRLRLGTIAVNRPFATVRIALLQTIGNVTGCHHWTGDYRLRHIGSRWLIDAANLTKHSC
jgi:hypothetical protein